MKWNDKLEFSVPEPAQIVQFQAIADDVNTVDFGEVTFAITDAEGKQVLVAKSEGLFKDWFVDVAQKLQPGRHQITMKVSNDLERLYLIRVASC